MKLLKALEVTLRRVSKPREKWGPFNTLKELLDSNLPLGESSCFQLVIKANGGYARDHEKGMTAIINFRGEVNGWGLRHDLEAALSGYEEAP